VWPGSGPWPEKEAPIRSPGSFGQEEHSAKGYQDTGPSSLEGLQELLRSAADRPEGVVHVRDIMTPNVECTYSDATLQAAAAKMRDLNIGILPVRDRSGRLAGTVTDRDLAVRAVADAKDPAATKVQEVMTFGIVFCFDDQDIHIAAKLMEERRIRRLVVLDRRQQPIGIVSLGDLAAKGGDRRLTGEALEFVVGSAQS
jgi:CBS domain-containing protein